MASMTDNVIFLAMLVRKYGGEKLTENEMKSVNLIINGGVVVPNPKEEGSTDGDKKLKKAKKKLILPNGEELKRPKNAYMFYRQENIERIKAENPDAKMVEQATILGEEWKGLSEEEKTKYQKMADDEKSHYEAVKDTAESVTVEPKKRGVNPKKKE